MAKFAKDYADKQSKINKDMQDSITSGSSAANAKIKQLEADKAAAVLLEQTNKDKTLNKMGEDFNKMQETLQKKKLQVQYDADVAAWESTRGTKIAEITIQGLAAAFSAYAALAPIPVVGIILGAAMAALIGGATIAAIASISGSPGPVKPAGLLRQGGYIAGNTTHEQGGFASEIESKEFMIDKGRTAKMFDAIDNNMIGGKGDMNFNFGPGSISGSNMDSEETASKMSQILADLLRRQGLLGTA
jgi:hypothetical protein